MPAVKIPFRLKAPDLSFGEAFQARYQARIDRPIDDLDLDEVFKDIHDNLRAGDWVTFVAYKDRTWQQVMEWRTAIITSRRAEVAGGKSVIRAAWADDYGKTSADAVTKSLAQVTLKLIVKKEFGGGFTVQDERGAVIERFKTKGEAEAYIDNLNGKPKAKAEAA
jgi:hypothetical protein